MSKINLDQLSEMVKNQPQYTKLFIGLSQIDKFVKGVVADTIEAHTEYPKEYYVKTELSNNEYILSLFNVTAQQEYSTKWPIGTFLEHCRDKTIEFQVQTAVVRLIKKFSGRSDE